MSVPFPKLFVKLAWNAHGVSALQKISLSGVRVNSRHRERKGWKKARRSTSSDERSPQRKSKQSTSLGRASGSGHQPGTWLPALPGSIAPLPHSSPSPSSSPQSDFTFTHPHRMPGPSALFAVHPAPMAAGPDSTRGAFSDPWAKSGVVDSDMVMGDETEPS